MTETTNNKFTLTNKEWCVICGLAVSIEIFITLLIDILTGFSILRTDSIYRIGLFFVGYTLLVIALTLPIYLTRTGKI